MREDIIFYSWQSDLPSRDNRNFIKDCIEKAVKAANRDEMCMEVDRDTNGISGFPNIQQAILQKIEKASIFVADISIVNKIIFTRKRRTPNPNVLFELGFAVKALGWERILCVFNSDYGKIEELPFDIKQHRIISYSLRGKDKKNTKNQVVGAIKNTLHILAEKGFIYSGDKDLTELMIKVPTDVILFSSFVDGKMMSCYINLTQKVDFYVKEASQGEWRINGCYGNRGFNFINDFLKDIDYETDKLQISCVDLDGDGEKEIVVSVGDGLSSLEALIYRFVPDSANIFDLCGRIDGQQEMCIDIKKGTITAPFGGQGMYNEYIYWDKRLWGEETLIKLINR